jgi:hypothetical protein
MLEYCLIFCFSFNLAVSGGVVVVVSSNLSYTKLFRMKYLYIIMAILFITGSILTYHACQEKTYCGKIIHKLTYDHHSKHSATETPLMIVRFDNGKTREIHPGWITFLEHEVGDSVCFELTLDEMDEGIIPMVGVWGILCWVLIIFCGMYRLFEEP